MKIKVTFECAVCGIEGHGKVELLPNGVHGEPHFNRLMPRSHRWDKPRLWHIEAKDGHYTAHCSQLCLVQSRTSGDHVVHGKHFVNL